MIKKLFTVVAAIVLLVGISSCHTKTKNAEGSADSLKTDTIMQKKLAGFATVRLTTDLSQLSEKEKLMIPLLIEVAQIMDELYWQQSFGDKAKLFSSIADESTRKFAGINYGPWERLNDNKPFIPSYGEKPLGATFYPADMTKEEFEKLSNKDKTSLYTVIRRNADRSLKVVWYHDEYREKLLQASDLIKKAAILAEDTGLKRYLEMRAEALLTSNYQPSDFAWMDMKTNKIDFVVGPIENYEDALFGYKAAFESFVLVKDIEWSKKLEKYLSFLPMLQNALPVEAKYKKEKPATSSDLGVYDAIYYAGDCNSGSKTIAINLPNDEQVQLKKGSRRLQLKNSMKAKFDNILVPIADKLIDPSQKANIKFDAFFNNVMFHEVAHGLGVKNTINGKGTVREAMKDTYSSFEEAKADILGLFMATQLIEKGEIKNISAEDCYVTFIAGIFRSVRFGAASSHGKANMMCFNFFEQKGAFTRNADGTYKVDFAKTKTAVDQWAAYVLHFEANGDYIGAVKYLQTNGIIRQGLQKDLDSFATTNIPVDVVFEQGLSVLQLQ